MDYEFNIKEGDPATNSLMAEMVTRLSEAEEARWRELLADAWDEGYAQKDREFRGLRLMRRNPYRRETKD